MHKEYDFTKSQKSPYTTKLKKQKTESQLEITRMDTASIGLVGEFYVLAQLTQREYVATLTLGNAKRIDILAFNPNTKRYWRVEVKTTREPAKSEYLFGKEKFFIWQLTEKHETINEPDLLYCFVWLSSSPDELPRFFIVPSAEVSRYAKWQHQKWLNAPREGVVKDGPKRKFRIALSDPDGYSKNWALFDTKSA